MGVKAEGFLKKKKKDNNDKHISLQASWQLDEEAMALGSLLSLVKIDRVTNIKAL